MEVENDGANPNHAEFARQSRKQQEVSGSYCQEA